MKKLPVKLALYSQLLLISPTPHALKGTVDLTHQSCGSWAIKELKVLEGCDEYSGNLSFNGHTEPLYVDHEQPQTGDACHYRLTDEQKNRALGFSENLLNSASRGDENGLNMLALAAHLTKTRGSQPLCPTSPPSKKEKD